MEYKHLKTGSSMISWRASARKRVFSASLRFAPFILPVFMGWGKRQIPLISPWLASVILQNFEFPHLFPSNSKQCREFSPAQGQRSQFIPLYSPTYSPGWPGVLPQGQADDMCIIYFIHQNVAIVQSVWYSLLLRNNMFVLARRTMAILLWAKLLGCEKLNKRGFKLLSRVSLYFVSLNLKFSKPPRRTLPRPFQSRQP